MMNVSILKYLFLYPIWSIFNLCSGEYTLVATKKTCHTKPLYLFNQYGFEITSDPRHALFIQLRHRDRIQSEIKHAPTVYQINICTNTSIETHAATEV